MAGRRLVHFGDTEANSQGPPVEHDPLVPQRWSLFLVAAVHLSSSLRPDDVTHGVVHEGGGRVTGVVENG